MFAVLQSPTVNILAITKIHAVKDKLSGLCYACALPCSQNPK